MINGIRMRILNFKHNDLNEVNIISAKKKIKKIVYFLIKFFECFIKNKKNT